MGVTTAENQHSHLHRRENLRPNIKERKQGFTQQITLLNIGLLISNFVRILSTVCTFGPVYDRRLAALRVNIANGTQ